MDNKLTKLEKRDLGSYMMVCGAAIALASLWLGSWVLGFIGRPFEIATLITMFLFMGGGTYMFSLGWDVYHDKVDWP